jgi:DNA-binding SARP family transcriptional activator/tetratricopeptide (TPR) repeat protein
MEFRLLGPLEVRRDGVAVPVRPGKQRTVLAALLLAANRVVTLDELAEILWADRPPPSARVTVQNYVKRLRQALADEGGLIGTRPGGYLIRIDPGNLDVTRFRALVDAARAAARDGSSAVVATQAEAALSLWRGEPLGDVDSAALSAREVPPLAEWRLQAEELRVDAALRLGRHAEIITDAQRLALAHPLRERPQALLMLAMYRDGRQAEALAAYQAARAVLIRELGTEPGRVLRDLHRQILSASPALEITSDAALPAPGAPRTSVAALPRPGAPRTSVVSATRTLPPGSGSFTGRQAELAELMAAAGQGRICAISGMPGAGKTALAVQAARLLADQFPHGRLFVDLHAHTPGQAPADPKDALAALLTATGVDARFLPPDTDGRSALWRETMARQQALVILDNAGSSAQVTPLLPGGGSFVLVTSRRHLGDLPGPPVPVDLEALPPDQARAMFLELAPRAAGPADSAAVADLTALAGYLPLAISLLARVYARHPSWTMADLAADTRSRLLTLAAERDSVAAAFEVSHRYLPAGRQRFFARLGLHPGTTIERYAAAALAGVSLDEAAAHLDALHGEGLLTEVSYRRYAMHDLIRRYARERAAADPGAGQALDRLLDYYQHVAADAERRLTRLVTAPAPGPPPGSVPALPDYTRALAWARAERGNLTACLDFAAEAGQHARVVAFTGASAALLHRDGPWDEAVTRHAAATRAARQVGDQRGEASALTSLAVARRLTGDSAGAIRDLQAALRISRACGHRLGQANALATLGVIGVRTGDNQLAVQALTEALGIYRDIGARRGEAYALHSLGEVRRQVGSYRAAIETLQEALSICGGIDDRLGQAAGLAELGFVWRATGDYPAAVQVLQEALEIHTGNGDLIGQADVLGDLGYVQQVTGDYAGAARSLERALRIWRESGIRQGQGNALMYLGEMRRASGDHPGAARDLSEALGIYRAIGDRGGEVAALNASGRLALARADLDQARACHQRALELAEEIDSPPDRAHALAGLGRCARRAGQTTRARTALRQAREIFERIGAAEAAAVAAEADALR